MNLLKNIFICYFLLYIPQIYAARTSSALEKYYEASCKTPSDIFEHLPILKEISSECSSAVEIGIRDIVSTWSILQGLSENPDDHVFYIGINLNQPPKNRLQSAKNLAKYCKIDFYFLQKNSAQAEIPIVDLLFIDSLHTYAHLTTELERYCGNVNKYIALHDTSDPWGHLEDSAYTGDYSEYAKEIDRSKKGLWPAVVDFLERHPEWFLEAHYTNNHGFTILKRM